MNRPPLAHILPPSLAWHPDGEIRLVGHRIGLHHVILALREGDGPSTLRSRFPDVHPATLEDVITLDRDHQEQVDAYIAAYRADIERQRTAGPHAPGIADLRRAHEARQRAATVDADRT